MTAARAIEAALAEVLDHLARRDAVAAQAAMARALEDAARVQAEGANLGRPAAEALLELLGRCEAAAADCRTDLDRDLGRLGSAGRARRAYDRDR